MDIFGFRDFGIFSPCEYGTEEFWYVGLWVVGQYSCRFEDCIIVSLCGCRSFSMLSLSTIKLEDSWNLK